MRMIRGSKGAALLVATALSLAAAPGWAQGLAQTTAAAARSFDIPAQSLGDALTEFGRQSGLQLSVESTLISGKRSARIQGAMSSPEALSRLLAGTGLAFRIDGNTVTLERAPAAAGTVSLDPVTVLGTRAPNVPLSNVPSSITYVGEETIQKETAVSARLEEILARNLPGLSPSNLGVRTIRGRTAQVFVNGAPTNEQMRHSSGSDLNVIAPEHLEAVEVSRGANSAYGFGSPGGIIALTTPRADSETLELDTRLRTSFNTAQPGGSFQTTLYQSAAQIVGKFDYHVGASLSRDGTNYTPDGEVANIFTSPALLKNGDENIYNVDGSFGYDLGDAGRLRWTSTYQHIDWLKYYDLSGGVYRQTFATGAEVPDSGRSKRQAATTNLTYENDEIAGSAVKLELFGSDVDTSRYESGSVRFDVANRYMGFRSAITTPLDTVMDGLSVSYGLDAVRNRMNFDRYNSDTGALTGVFVPETTLDMLAPYAQAELPIGKTTLSVGVRQEFYGGEVASVGNNTVTPTDDIAGGDIRDFDIALFNAGLLHELTGRIDLHATYSQGAEITQLGRAAFGATSTDRVDPQAARSHQYELGARYHQADLSAALATFYTHSKLMSSVDCSDTTIPCLPLREPRRFWGVEFSGDWQIDEQWTLAGTLAWQDGRRKASGSPEWTRVSSADIAPLVGSISLGYAPEEWWRNTLIMDWRGGRGRISTAWPYGPVRPQAVLHLVSGFDIGPGTLQFGVHNLLDQTYASIQAEAYGLDSTWVPEQGRRVSMGYSIKW